MPKTIIKIRTWFCPQCEYRQDFEPTDELMVKNFGRSGVLCPSCKGADLGKEINSNKKITMTVMGEEDIESEIEQAIRGERKDIDVSTEAKKTAYRTKRKQNIAEAIERAKTFEDI